MKYAVSIIIVMLCIGISNSMAQNPYKAQGVHVEPLTLSKGKYNEFFTNDTLVQIGSVLFNTNTNKVVKYLEPDSSGIPMPEPGSSSRFLSIDPLAAKYPSVSPYNYALSNPIKFYDPDGKEVKDCCPTNPSLFYALKHGGAKTYNEQNQINQMTGAGTTIGVSSIAGATTVYAAGAKTTLAFIGNEIKDEIASQVTGGMTDYVDLSKTLLNFGKIGVDQLSSSIKNNLKRFEKKLPKNAQGSVDVFQTDDGVTIFSATSPGEVKGSKAIYTKVVNAEGETSSYIKTTFDPDGNIVHIKDKISGEFIIDNRKN